jgi:hypothetical protein
MLLGVVAVVQEKEAGAAVAAWRLLAFVALV